MKKRTILLGVAVLVLGLFFLPQAMSTFTNQHTWQETDDLDCVKCHPAIETEISASNHHGTSQLGGAGINDACVYCHQTNFVAGEDAAGDFTASGHAAITIECLDCHGSGANNDDTLTNDQTGIDAEFTSGNEAHEPMYTQAGTETPLLGANEACVACHTEVAVTVTFSGELSEILIDASLDSSYDWTVDYDYSL